MKKTIKVVSLMALLCISSTVLPFGLPQSRMGNFLLGVGSLVAATVIYEKSPGVKNYFDNECWKNRNPGPGERAAWSALVLTYLGLYSFYRALA